jgi:glycosyltransferase involved in cell wall biosynthesis
MIAEGELFAVVVPTRNRGGLIGGLLNALDRQTDRDFHVVVVDQSDVLDPALERRAAASDRFHVISDSGKGASRARNVGLRSVGASWIAYVDDDCVPEPEWAERLRAELLSHPEADAVFGEITADQPPGGDYQPVARFPVSEARLLRGRFTRPWRVGYSVSMAIRRSTIEELGGWDERFGPGTSFPASDDMDLNLRLMRAGGSAYLTPRLRVAHEQWRTGQEVLDLYGGYCHAWGGLAAKQLRTGDPLGAMLLSAGRIRGIWKLVLGAVRSRSRYHLTLALTELKGFVRGLAAGLRRSW